MKIIKKQLSLESGISRTDSNYGQLTNPYFYFKIHLTQSITNMGIFTDYPFDAAPYELVDLTDFQKTLRPSGAIVDNWYTTGVKLSGITESRLDEFLSYNLNQRFVPNFDIDKGEYTNFSGGTVNGATRLTQISGNTYTYVFDANNDVTIGTSGQTSGLLYIDAPEVGEITSTQVQYISEGWNETNTSLSAITKQEYLMSIISPPEIKNELFIERGQISVFENHLRLSEVESLDHLVRYGNGFYNVVNQ